MRTDPNVLPSGTVTFLLTDVAGSTPMWEADADAMAAAMSLHHGLLRQAVADHGGVHPLEQGEGDSMVAAFTRACDAIGAAVDAQLALRAQLWPEGAEIRVRMGIHSGDATPLSAGTYQGPAIIRCPRLRGLAHGGQVLVSASTAALAADMLPAGTSLVDLGVHPLKGLRRPEAVWQLLHPSLPAVFPALIPAGVARTNVPLTVTTFIDRDEGVKDLVRRLDHQRLVTLTGMGGSGKTRLANELALRVVDDYPNGVWWAELAAARSDDEVVEIVARAMSVTEEPGRPLIETLVDHAGRATGPLLVVIDNCEHVIAAVAALVDRLIHVSAYVRVLTTSREALAVPGEVIIGVPLLDPTTAATDLFVDRATAALPGLQLGNAERAVVADICSRLDGIPLAIELAAARLRAMPLQRVASGLDDALRILTGGPRTAVRRQQTMQACIAWSVDQLSGAERAVLRRLAVFTGTFTLDAAEGTCSGADVDAPAVIDAIRHLVDKSLLSFDPGSGRYRILEVLRQHGLEALLAADELEATRIRHSAWFCDWVRSLAPAGRRTDAAHAMIALDHANVAAAIDFALDRDPAMALETLACLCGYFGFADRSTEAARRFTQLSSREEKVAPVSWARALGALGLEASWAGATDLDALERARVIAADAGDLWAELLVRFDLAMPASFVGDFGPMDAVVLDAERAGFEDIELYGRLQVGCMHNLLDHSHVAIGQLAPLVRRMRRLDWQSMANVPIAHTALAMSRLGRLAEAISLIDEVGTGSNAVAVILGETYRATGLLMADDDLLEAARATLTSSDWGLMHTARQMLVCTEALQAGDLERAVGLFMELRPLQFLPIVQLTIDELLAPCLTSTGDLAAALSACERLDLAGATFDSRSAVTAAALCGAAVAATSGATSAGSLAIDAVRAAREGDNTLHLIDALELVTIALAHAGRASEAARIDTVTQKSRTELAYRWRWPHVERMRREAVATISGALGEWDLERLGEGADTLSLSDTAALVLTDVH